MKLRLFVPLILLMVSCTESDNKFVALIDDTQISVEGKRTLMSSLIDMKNIIPLETTDSCLLGTIEKVIKVNGHFYIKSKNRPLMVFSETGKFERIIGSLGMAPEEYVELGDYDVDDDNIYISTINKIQIYTKEGIYVRTIPLSLNVSNIRVFKNRILLFVLGDEYVLHLLNKEGREITKALERNQALRLCKAVPFIKYMDKYLLFAQGRSNNLVIYDMMADTFKNSMTYLASTNNLSIEKEASLMETMENYKKELNAYGSSFDGLSSSSNHIAFASIDNGEVTLWYKELFSEKAKAYSFSSLENDITYTGVSSFFYDNTDGRECFLSYAMPYHIAEGLEKYTSYSNTRNYKGMRAILDKLNIEDANPILIEYDFK